MTAIEADEPVLEVSLRKIILATDFSPACLRAAKHGAELARHFGARLYLTHVLREEKQDSQFEASPKVRESERHNAERLAAEIADASWMYGVSVEILIEPGYLIQRLERLILDQGIDLMIAGTSSRELPRSESNLPTAELISRCVACPVLTVGPGTDPQTPLSEWKNVLFPTDFGQAARHAAPYASFFARESGAVLTILHVLPQAGQERKDAVDTMVEITEVRLKESFPEDIQALCKMERSVAFGDPPEQILRVSKEKKADLIVMGARSGRTIITHLPGTAVRTVVATVRCPVLTVKG